MNTSFLGAVLRTLVMGVLGYAWGNLVQSRYPVEGMVMLALALTWFVASVRAIVAHRRLVHLLGGIHQIWANADRFEFLPILCRSHKAELRWWQWQLAWDTLVIVLTVTLLGYGFPKIMSNYWLAALIGALAWPVLTSKTLYMIHKCMQPEKKGTLTVRRC